MKNSLDKFSLKIKEFNQNEILYKKTGKSPN